MNHWRNIPAHAGKTSASTSTENKKPEHPRARGENIAECDLTLAEQGTSPRTRGKRLHSGVGVGCGGNIPAHAGKTLVMGFIADVNVEHPRARGENLVKFDNGFETRGTSPRTRGKPGRGSGAGGTPRNIPAHAGKTCGAPYTPAPNQEHPRARGENVAFPFRHRGFQGTSPRTRGKRPRWCAAPHPERGTSPRTRGKPAVTWCGLPKGRNIPAHAGKTPSKTTTPSVAQEHPRARGENAHLLRAYRIRIGTSPRTRGKPVAGPSIKVVFRNIPAHAGKTYL